MNADERYDEFESELTTLINTLSMENGSDTPDFILASYLTKCLRVFDATTERRESWYRPSSNPDANNPNPDVRKNWGKQEGDDE